MMVAIMIMVSPVAIVVILMVPMSLVDLPAFAIVVVMRMTPVCPFKGRTFPAPPDPPVLVTNWFPISFQPDEARTWSRSILLIADRRWRGPDVHRNLRRTRRDNSGCEQRAIHPIQSHFVSPSLEVGRLAFFQHGHKIIILYQAVAEKLLGSLTYIAAGPNPIPQAAGGFQRDGINQTGEYIRSRPSGCLNSSTSPFMDRVTTLRRKT